MEKKSLLQYFREEAETNQRLAVRVVKTLAENRIYTIDLLMAKTPNELYEIKGIGEAAMNLIGRVMTKEKAIRENLKNVYDKNCHECKPVSLRDWILKSGVTYVEACTIDKIMRKNGVKNVDIFMNLTQKDCELMDGIAEKRLMTIQKTKEIISKKRRKHVEKNQTVDCAV